MKPFSKIYFGLICGVLGTSFFLHASNLSSELYCYQERAQEQSQDFTNMPQEKDSLNPGYNAPVELSLKNPWYFSIEGSFIYWKPMEMGLDVGRLHRDIFTPFPSSIWTSKKLDFDYHPGFKVGIEGRTTYDNWALHLEYWRFHSKDSSKYSLSDARLTHRLDSTWNFHTVFIPDPLAERTAESAYELGSTWRLYLDLLNLELSRNFYVGTKLSTKPYLGLMGGRIDQKYHTQGVFALDGIFTPANVRRASANIRSDSWLIGPRVGIDSSWNIFKYFRILGNVAAGLFYQDFDAKYFAFRPDQPGTGSNTARGREIKDQLKLLNTMFEVGLGLGWEGYCLKDVMHFDLSLSYEFILISHQNMINYVVSKNQYRHQTQSPHDLSFKGLTATLCLDF